MRRHEPNFHIRWERFPYRDGPDVHWFQHEQGTTPICKAYRVEGGWELLFFRGPSNRGPYFYREFKQLKRHLDWYLHCHGDALVGPRKDAEPSQPHYIGENRPQRAPLVPDPVIQVPRRRARRRSR